MAFEMRDMSGSLFLNDRKNAETHPDWKGRCLINGRSFWMSAWVKRTDKGVQFFSLSFQDAVDKPSAQPGGYQQPQQAPQGYQQPQQAYQAPQGYQQPQQQYQQPQNVPSTPDLFQQPMQQPVQPPFQITAPIFPAPQSPSDDLPF